MIKDILEKTIKEALESLSLPNETEITLEHPVDLRFGDYSTNIAMALAKQMSEAPKVVADKIVAKIAEQKNDWLAKVEVAGAGFINFYLSKKFFESSLKEVLDAGEKYGSNNLGQGKIAIVEYSSPNIAKPFSIGHLRSTIIGDVIANLLVLSNFNVVRDNHLGDWGTQFGKLIVAIKKWGDFEKIKQAENPVKELVALYVKFHEEAEKDLTLEDEGRLAFTKLEQGDKELRAVWQSCVDLSLVSFNTIYDYLGVKFDTYHGESFFIDKITTIHSELEKKGILVESEGAKIVMFADETKLPPLIIEKSDGSSIYATRDLAADFWRKKEYSNPVLIINEAGVEQSLYFRQLYETEKTLGWFEDGQRVHVSHGLYRFLDGKMSTRKGNVIWLEDVLNEAVTRAKKFDEDSETAEAVAIGALKYNDLKRDSKMDIVFDWDEVLNLKGNSGPYLQYTYARINSILEKTDSLQIGEWGEATREYSLEKWLYRFPEIVERSANEYAPHHICTYLYELASAFSAYYEKNKIIGSDDEAYRLSLAKATGQILKNGLTLLGIKTPAKI